MVNWIAILSSLFGVTILMAIFLYAGKLELHKNHFYSHWLSFAAGVSMAYVFLHLLPELSLSQGKLPDFQFSEPWSRLLDLRVYFMALLGVMVYLGLQRPVHYTHENEAVEADTSQREVKLFHLHVSGYYLYNALIGYLLANSAQSGWLPLLLITIVMGLHFLIIVHGLSHEYGAFYTRTLQSLLAAAILVGWFINVVVYLPGQVKFIVFSFLAGGLIVNTIKEELPTAEEGRFGPSITGVLGYSVLLVAFYSAA